jgi:hypothetical protein
VFLFDDVDVYMFPSLDSAEGWMEAVDVDCGEYTTALTETGRVIRMRTENEDVVLDLTDEMDLATLQELLREHGKLIGHPGVELDPVGFANRSWMLEWENRATAHDFTAEQMLSWYREHDLLTAVEQQVIDQTSSLDETVERVLSDLDWKPTVLATPPGERSHPGER